jgi:hypothetical protein
MEGTALRDIQILAEDVRLNGPRDENRVVRRRPGWRRLIGVRGEEIVIEEGNAVRLLNSLVIAALDSGASELRLNRGEEALSIEYRAGEAPLDSIALPAAVYRVLRDRARQMLREGVEEYIPIRYRSVDWELWVEETDDGLILRMHEAARPHRHGKGR